MLFFFCYWKHIIKGVYNIEDIANTIIDLKIQLILNKRLFLKKEIPIDLYEKVENNLLFKLHKLEEKCEI